jgi:hypothetical protein
MIRIIANVCTVPATILKCFAYMNYFNLHNNPLKRCYDYPHFKNAETDAQRLSDFPKVAWPVRKYNRDLIPVFSDIEPSPLTTGP